MSAFGANEWLVDEMYERFLKDPDSVDKVWWDFFDKHPSDPAQPSSGAPGRRLGGKRQQRQGDRVHRRAQEPDRPAQPVPGRDPGKSKPAATAVSKAQPPTSEKKSESTPVNKADASPPPPAEKSSEKTATSAAKPTPKDPEKKAEAEAADEPSYTVLRGAPARTVANMDASLSVPTATSVRSVPVKLLWDNRIVINNHLARARGGKVSFTHLIGYALVKALNTMPEMNVGFDVVDGKPNLITPAHINLGLAIDLPKSDGTRQLLVPSIKAAETMDFAHFWTAYEELVRKARGGKLQVTDFQGTTISLTNPGTIGTNHSVPRLMKGQGAIIGVGSMELPARLPGRLGGDGHPQRDQQGHDADLDVRPPGHPGRPER